MEKQKEAERAAREAEVRKLAEEEAKRKAEGMYQLAIRQEIAKFNQVREGHWVISIGNNSSTMESGEDQIVL